MYVCDILVFQPPKIDWSAYNVTVPADSLKPPTRKTSNKPTDSSSDSVVLVRGRQFDDSKPETFNQVCVTHRLLEMYMLLIRTEIQNDDKDGQNDGNTRQNRNRTVCVNCMGRTLVRSIVHYSYFAYTVYCLCQCISDCV